MNAQHRRILLVSILASLVAFLDGSVVNVALPAITRDLGGGLAVQQWVVDAYLISLGALILLAGSFSDLFGRIRVLTVGLAGFALASLLCAVAPTSTFLILARGLQGMAGALLVPSSLALIIDSFDGEAQSKAIGTWTAWTGLAFIFGPLFGGILVDMLSWRYIFAINLLPITATLIIMRRLSSARHHTKVVVDWLGAWWCVLGLALPVYALIEQPRLGWGHPGIYVPLLIGVLSMGLFIRQEKRSPAPMLPLSLFKQRNFSAGNLATVSIYGGLSIATFLLVLFVQQVGNYSALASGLSLLPIVLIMFLLSPQFGKLAGRYGPRLFMTIGPLIASVGFLLFMRVSPGVRYATEILPGVIVFGLGLSATVAPLTSAVLGSVPKQHSGIASAVNNAISRIAGLLAIAAIGVVIGQTLSLASFKRGVLVMSVLLALGGVISYLGIRNTAKERSD